ncbi:Helix-turn-helix domain protein [Poriferisphaera corsica]|uniref:Helix-turn-helix domain protein n=1 Tax=Poriferisphaera corsica TaxID=2528020 RepID=A0A517YS32_9BACT|nr:Helix-turn-helix domain protein [Poriferisphaera corsica]
MQDTYPIAHTSMLNVKDVARRLQCSPRTVYRLCDAGLMPKPIKLGQLIRWNADTIEQWIAQGCPKQPTSKN